MSIFSHDFYIRSFSSLNLTDRSLVGGKNASLGELTRHLNFIALTPDGFALTTHFFHDLLADNGLDIQFKELLSTLKATVNDDDLEIVAKNFSDMIGQIKFTDKFLAILLQAYEHLDTGNQEYYAVRSSSIDEDNNQFSFAGQHDTFLGIRGFSAITHAILNVYASLFNVRSLRYRLAHGLPLKTEFSVGVQKMAYDLHMCSGVIFTADPETHEQDLMVISSSYGLGEGIVSGQVNPDEFLIYKKNCLKKEINPILKRILGSKEHYITLSRQKIVKKKVLPALKSQFSLNDRELIELARIGIAIEDHYGTPMDIEWAKINDTFTILQARPMTRIPIQKQSSILTSYVINDKGPLLLQGYAVGHAIVSGRVTVINDASQLVRIKKGDILVTTMTDMSWESVLPKVAGIVTNKGGRTCHAAIVSRELGIPTIVGTERATEILEDGMLITLDCSQGSEGFIYQGSCSYDVIKEDAPVFDKLPVDLLLNISKPSQAFKFAKLPSNGVGLTRMEFIINNTIKIHPCALLQLENMPNTLQNKIKKLIAGYATPEEFYIAKLTEGIGTIAAAFHPRMVVVRFSDLKSNEYRRLIGGSYFETFEENPMLGYRGAARYVSKEFQDAFQLECEAIKRARTHMGLKNIWVMIPFVRTVEELKKTLSLMESYGLIRGKDDLKVLVNCELPANIMMVEEFLELVDGYSVGSNDLTQLTLGIDRDAGREVLLSSFDERNPAVLRQLAYMLGKAHAMGKYIGICGQGPSDHYDFAKFLIQHNITSLSLNPDKFFETVKNIIKDPDL